MIIYESSKKDFCENVINNNITDQIINSFKIKGINYSNKLKSEIRSWQNSMQFVNNLLNNNEINDDTYVAIEYKIPFTSNRIDFMLFGEDENQKKNFVILELKQWEKAEDSNKEDLVITWVGNANREVLHPSYQAMQYLYSLSNFNESLVSKKINGYSYAYLHNADKENNKNLLNSLIYTTILKHPIYFKNDTKKLKEKIIQLVGKGKGKEILYTVENGKIVPSKNLMETIANTLDGKKEYELIDSQKIVFENIISKANESNNVFIINGNPGTGKSVVAINLLSKLLNLKKSVALIAPNTSFKNVIINSLKNKKNKEAINTLIKGSTNFYLSDDNAYDWLIIDEAHRLKDKAYMYKGKNQVEDVIRASKNTIFFVDEKQVIRNNDIGNNETISQIAKKYNKNIFNDDDYKLKVQFRCGGSEGFLNAVETTLQIEETGNFYLNDDPNFEFKIFDTPQELEKEIYQKRLNGNTARLVAGYAWPWINKNLNRNELVISDKKDINIEEYNYSINWNFNDGKMLWSIDQEGEREVGCVHSCQGIEFDYVGVIIGNDIGIDENNNIIVNWNNYYDSEGKKGLKEKPELLIKFIKNIYKILMTRGKKGCYLFVRDKKLKEYFIKHTKNN